MSITDPAESVQPEQGQGGGGNDAPYAEYLNRIPEEGRAAAEEAFKAWDADTTRKFQDAAEHRKAWEPFEQLGVNQRDPSEVEWALSMLEAAKNNPQSIAEWYEQYAEQHGLTPAEAAQQAAAAQPAVDEFGGIYDQAALESLLQSQLTPLQQRLDAIAQREEAREYKERLQEAERHIEEQFTQLQSQHPDAFDIKGADGKPIDVRAVIENFTGKYIETDPQHAVQRAFADWDALRSQLESGFLNGKAQQPGAPEGGGVANTQPEQIKTLAQANEIALQRIRGSREQ